MEHNGCKGCAYEFCSGHFYPCNICTGTKQRDFYKKITWADKIRCMDNEELAILIYKLTYGGKDAVTILKWLESDYEESE